MRMNLGRYLGLLAIAASVSLTDAVSASPPTARKIYVAANGTQNFSTTRRAISFYDVTDLSGSNVFNQQPLFSAWVGWEDSIGANFEEISAITVNPYNGTVYQLSFDSGTAGNVDAVGDTEGDYDLYRINYQALLEDFETNNRPVGTMYAPVTTTDGFNNIDHPDNPGTTVFTTAISKIGEVARSGPLAGGGADAPFFDPQMAFRDASQLVLLDNQRGPDGTGDTPDNDHRIRVVERVNTTPGGDPGFNSTTQEGGFSQQTSETWQSDIATLVNMDFDANGNLQGRSEPESIAYVRRDGVEGIWVGESDGGSSPLGANSSGDDISFFQIDFSTNTAEKKEIRVGGGPYPDGFALDQDPVANPNSNDGSHDWIEVDGNGNLVIGESGFFDAPQHEPKVIRRDISDYDGADTDANTENEVVPGGWSVSNPLPTPTADDDTAVTDGRFVAFDKGENRVFYADIDSGSQPNVVTDIYVFDLDTNTFVYQEQNALNQFVLSGAIELFVRGDFTGDGLVKQDDIDKLFSLVADPTDGGFFASAIGAETFDITGDNALVGGTSGLTSDTRELVEDVLGTRFGDANLDGLVSLADLSTLQINFGSTSVGFAGGNFNGDSSVSLADLALLQQNFGFNNMAVNAPASLALSPSTFSLHTNVVPEASSLVFVGIGSLLGLSLVARRRQD